MLTLSLLFLPQVAATEEKYLWLWFLSLSKDPLLPPSLLLPPPELLLYPLRRLL